MVLGRLFGARRSADLLRRADLGEGVFRVVIVRCTVSPLVKRRGRNIVRRDLSCLATLRPIRVLCVRFIPSYFAVVVLPLVQVVQLDLHGGYHSELSMSPSTPGFKAVGCPCGIDVLPEVDSIKLCLEVSDAATHCLLDRVGGLDLDDLGF